jgi:Tol biopolymer transport system component
MCKSLPVVGILACLLLGCRSTHPTQPPLSFAVFAPDGSSILFSAAQGRDCFLYTAEIATGRVSRFTHALSGCESDPAFSPDGKQVAFMRAPANGSRAALVVAKADSSGERVLVPAGEDNLHPVFVPHSQTILFLRSGAFEHHSPLVDNRRHNFDLFAVDAATGNVSGLTNKRFYEISDVSVSSDGERVMLTVSVYPEGDEFLIASIKDAQNPTQVLQPKVPGSPSLLALYNAEWLPDNHNIVFQAATLPSSGGNYDYNVYRMTIQTGAVERLTRLNGLLDGFRVSLDGKRAVLLRQDEYSVLDLTTQQLTAIALKRQ